MKKLLLLLCALLTGVSGVWAALTTVSVSAASDSKGNYLEPGAFYRILLPSRNGSVALKQNGEYVQAYNGYGIIGYMWKIEEDANGKALISNPTGGYWKFTDYNEGNSKVKTNGTAGECTAFQMAWASSANKTFHLFDPNGGSYSYDGIPCGAVLSNHGGVGNNMGIFNNLSDAGSIFKFERFYQTKFLVSNVDVNGVAVENYPTTVTINGNITASEYYTNSDNLITSFSTTYGAAYYIDGVEKTAEEVKNAINANTSTLTVTVKPQPFVASTVESPVYYALMISGNANSWWQNVDGTVVRCSSGNTIPAVTARQAWIWEIKQNSTSGYKIYSVDAGKYLGGRTATGGPFTLGDDASANTFKCYYNSGATIKFKDYTNDLWIDRGTVNNIGQPYAHTSGQQITFLPMYKVTFSTSITVNDVNDVTTIYVKGDGSDSFTLPSDKLYSINGADPMGYADAVTAIAACSSNLTVTVSANSTKDVTYVLKWSDGTTINTVNDVETELLTPSSDYVPAAFVNDFTTLSYSPEEITSETSEVTVTATWNGPFQISDNFNTAKWQVVQMHTYGNNAAEKWSWSYKSDDSNKVKPEQVLAYDAVTTNRLFCFVGNPYSGFKIYNAAAGSGSTLTRTEETVELTMASGDHIFTLHKSTTNPDASTYFALKPSGATNYVNFDYTNKKIAGWNAADNGSTCWVVAPGQYYLDFIDGLYLDAPVGAVGTRAYFQSVANVETVKSNIRGYRMTVAANMYSNELGSLNTYLDPVKATDVITLTNGYYRFVNAFPSWATNVPTIYYNSANNRIEWSKASNVSDNVNSIFYIDASAPSIFSPNAQKYMSVVNSEVSGSLADAAGTTVFTSLGKAQYNVVVGGGTMHTAGHNSGAGASGNLTSWGGGNLNTADAWYIVKVEDINLPLNLVNGKSYATMYMPFDVTLPSETVAYTVAVEGGRAKLTAVDGADIKGGTPVLLINESGATNVTATITTGASELTGTNNLIGTYFDKTELATNEYIFGTSNGTLGFWKLGEGKKLGANKASLLSPVSGVKGFTINFDTPTGIDTFNEATQTPAIYDLQGRRVNAPTRGVYIVNGKKVAIK